jgi:hypothetical protein
MALVPIKDDATVLAALGHKEELNRQFTPFSMAANAIITASAWVRPHILPRDLVLHPLKVAWKLTRAQTAIIGTFITSIYNGGAAGMIYAWYDLPPDESAPCANGIPGSWITSSSYSSPCPWPS